MAADSDGTVPPFELDERPADGVWVSIEIAAERQANYEERVRPIGNRQRMAIMVVLAAAVLLVAVPLGLAARSYEREQAAVPRPQDEVSGVVALAPIRPDGIATGWAEASNRTLTIGADNLEKLDQGWTYELWLLDADTSQDGGDPVWIGSVGSGSEFAIDERVDLDRYRVVDISIEPVDGDASHSGDSVLRGSLEADSG